MPKLHRNIQKAIEFLSSTNIEKVVAKGTHAVEENVKIKLVIPLLNILGFNTVEDMDFEHFVQNKRADIAILVNQQPRLIIETKDLKEDLDKHIDQAIGYAFKKGVEWVMLTNGKEFRIYKTFLKDVASQDRLVYKTTLKKLPSDFGKLSNLISRKSLKEAGRLTKKAALVREKITVELLVEELANLKGLLEQGLIKYIYREWHSSADFRNRIKDWCLETEIDPERKDLMDLLASEGAYTFLNRMLFYRIAEDRNSIPTKFTLDKLNHWNDLFSTRSKFINLAFKDVLDKFSGLYNHPLFDSVDFEEIEWDEQLLDIILKRLSIWDFSSINSDFLGAVYEKHIPPEERKKLGQYYTDATVINYILDRIFRYAEEDGIDLSTTKLMDPSCGSGGFLIQAYERYKRIFLKKGMNVLAIHRKILNDHIHGIDINPFAAQLSIVNLMIKHMEEISQDFLIFEGNSLEKLEKDLDFEKSAKGKDASRIQNQKGSAFHGDLLRNHEFDFVVGNPPYVSYGLGRTGKLAKEVSEKLRNNYPESAEYKISIYAVFVNRAIEMLKEGGYLGFIIPDSFLGGMYFSKLRNYLINNTNIKEIVIFKEDFWNAVVGQPTILIIQKNTTDKNKRDTNKLTSKLCRKLNDLEKGDVKSYSFKQSIYQNTPRNRFRLFFSKKDLEFVSTCDNGSEIFSSKIEFHQGIRSKSKKENVVSDHKKGDSWHRALLQSDEINRYSIDYRGNFANVDPELLWSGGFEESQISRKKILVRRTGDTILATIDSSGLHLMNSLIYGIPNKENKNLSDELFNYILALLNSDLINNYYHIVTMKEGRVLPQVEIDTLHDLPLKIGKPKEIDEISHFVSEMLNKNKENPEYSKKINEIINKIYL